MWWREGGALLTPPLDGRLLPGVGRELLLAAGTAAGLAVAEARASIEQLADLPLVVTSARGAQAACLSTTSPETVREAEQLAAALSGVLDDRHDGGAVRASTHDV